ncbi:MAG: hypothetical protein KGQ38_04240 [Actinomycetales bacterium]|nr:hypothetical protein [Actinomycetales bacterium]
MIQTVFVVALVILLAVWFIFRKQFGKIHFTRKTLRVIALGVMLIGAGFFALFVVGEMMTDPGGTKGLLFSLLFLAPLIGLSLIAWRLPETSRIILAIGFVAVAILDIWTSANYDSWRNFEDRNGPIGTIAILALEIPLAVHAYYRDTRMASFALIYLGLVPPLLRSWAAGTFETGTLTRLITMSGLSPALLVGVLFLISSFLPKPFGGSHGVLATRK